MPGVACEPFLYHSREKFGYFSILQSFPSGKRQRTYRLNQMPDVIKNLDHDLDTWITQADFKGYNRRLVNFLRVGVAWVDLDYYNSEHAGTVPEKLAEQILWYCQYETIPFPSIIIYSGRGLQVKWLFSNPIPTQALVRWNTLQKYICSKFDLFGADPKAKDASRVLRLVDSVNTKSGDKCRIIYVNKIGDDETASYSFDNLCDAFFPYSRDEMQQLQIEQAETREQKQKFKVIEGGKKSQGRQFNEQTLNWHRLLDLRKLSRLRGWKEEAAAGYQDWCLFLAVCFLSWSIKPDRLFQEVNVLAREFCPTWRHDEAAAITKSAIARAHEASNGKKVKFDGKLYDPRYRFTNAFLIETLKITDNEQKELMTIISKDEARRRDRESATDRRRQAGMIDRATYQLTADQRKTEARLRHAKGENYKEIADALRISVDTVKGYLYRRV